MKVGRARKNRPAFFEKMKAIDLFAGLGGFTEGATQAGCKVVWAGNHWQSAVNYHALNHPETFHLCQDLHQANWEAVPKHDLMLASPSCQGFTPARGKDKPRHDAARATAWAAVSCAEIHRPAFIIVENVLKFLDWKLYPAWRLAMQSLGYSVSPHIFDSADFGVPQHRVRVFVIMARSKSPLRISPRKIPHVPIARCIQWEKFLWTQVEGHAEATLRRVANGRRQIGSQFAMPYYGSGSGETGRSLCRPIGTITTLDRWALVDNDRMRMFQPTEYRAAMGFPESYKIPNQRRLAIHLLGNAVCPPVAREIISGLN